MCGIHSWRFARQTRECGSFPSTPHWLKTAQMVGLSLNSRMAGKCHLGGHWRRGSSIREYPFSLCHKEYNVSITVYDPWANPAIAKKEYGIDIVNELPSEKFDAAIAAVAHKKFEKLDVPSLLKDKHVIFDVKCTLDRSIIDGRL